MKSESRLLAEWQYAANDLGIQVVGPICVELKSGVSIEATVLVRHFGGSNGMLVLSNYALVKDLTDEIIDAGYGYSIMREPESSANWEYERSVYMEILSDWGWCGPESQMPIWLEK